MLGTDNKDWLINVHFFFSSPDLLMKLFWIMYLEFWKTLEAIKVWRTQKMWNCLRKWWRHIFQGFQLSACKICLLTWCSSSKNFKLTIYLSCFIFIPESVMKAVYVTCTSVITVYVLCIFQVVLYVCVCHRHYTFFFIGGGVRGVRWTA